jgi:hypothetical protein
MEIGRFFKGIFFEERFRKTFCNLKFKTEQKNKTSQAEDLRLPPHFGSSALIQRKLEDSSRDNAPKRCSEGQFSF